MKAMLVKHQANQLKFKKVRAVIASSQKAIKLLEKESSKSPTENLHILSKISLNKTNFPPLIMMIESCSMKTLTQRHPSIKQNH